MGRKAPRTIYKLDFSDTPWGNADEDGDPAEVSMTGLTMDEQLETVELESTLTGETSLAGQKQAVARMMDLLAEHLVEWNLEDNDGNRITESRSGIGSQDPLFIMGILRAFRTAVSGVGKDSSQTSSGGARSLEASLPMEVSSASPGSSPGPSSSSDVASDSDASPASS